MSRHGCVCSFYSSSSTLAPIGGSSAARRVLSDEESHDECVFIVEQSGTSGAP